MTILTMSICRTPHLTRVKNKVSTSIRACIASAAVSWSIDTSGISLS